ncbi:MAG: D12 class N6 adenine-specific DNA methyltransferase [Candidatus Izimaplasma bacterium HR2]|nr:MAG: D12 class N6 adenine-specific DNA methyltransferase [Candidatus Izimaplasma bacterium HR2]
MKFVGSKNRLCKYIIPIIQEIIDDSNCDGYLEVCVGGANVIDKINHNNKIGSDIHKELIALLNYIKILNNPLPTTITEEEYKQVKNNKNNYPNWYIGLVGFCATYGSRYFQGFARGFKADKITPRDIPNEGIRNIEKQRKNLTDVKFYCKNFNEYTNEEINNYVIYCDIPYRSTKRYPEQPKFNYEEFYA